MIKKKIWIINHYATNMFYNKGGRHYWFAKYLKREGYEPVIFSCNAKHGIAERYVETDSLWIEQYAEDINVPFVLVKSNLYEGNGLKRIQNMLGFFRNIKKAAKEYARKNNRPDVIYASSVHPLTLVAGIQLAKYFGIKCICEIRDLWPESIFAFDKAKEKSILGKTLVAGEHWIYRKADALIFTKEGDIDYIKEKKWDTEQGGRVNLDKAHYINNGVDINMFNKASADNIIDDKDLESGKFNVVYVGAIRPVNNVGNMLDAAKLLIEDRDIQFLIYGAGDQKEQLDKRVADEELNNVKMKGFINKQYIPYILSKSSVNVLNYSPTQYNWSRGNSSNKLFEYLASGKPIISTVKMGYSIIKKYRCGIELEKSTPKELAQAIVDVKHLPEQEYVLLGANAKAAAINFDFKILTNRLINVIVSLD